MKLLYHCAFGTGGLAAYAHEQANALCNLGCVVTLATSEDYVHHGSALYKIVRLFPARTRAQRSLPSWLRRLGTARVLIRDQFRLAAYAEEEDFQFVLMGSYIEYLAPFWAWRFRKMARRGTVFAALVHDPVRDYVVGPLWWHRLSIAAGYSFIREAFVHAHISLETVRPMPRLRTTVIPHGPYHYPKANKTRVELRSVLDLPQHVPVLLSFGHLRDEKNLHLALEAMIGLPDLYLIVAGKPQSAGCRPGIFYQELAKELGVADRCRWLLRYIDNAEVAGLFTAADFVLLTYSANFRSASGVLNVAVFFRKPCVVSAGEGNLKQTVRDYALGVFVEPDDSNAIRAGLQQLLQERPDSRWEAYERDNSWELNAARVMAAMSTPSRSNLEDYTLQDLF